jgi:hypothetical protein
MSSRLARAALGASLLWLAGCTHSVHLVNFSDFRPYPSGQERRVEAQAEQQVVLGITDNTNYVNVAYRQLLEKCPRGQLTGIQTKFYTSHGFFSWTEKIAMSGVCAPETSAD